MTRALVTSILVVAALGASNGAAAARDDLLGPAYPIDVEISRVAALFQWVDSLAATSAAKTVPAHRQDFVRRWGTPSREENELLLRFRGARRAHDAAARDVGAMLGIFCEASSVEAALAAVRKTLPPEDVDDLAAALSRLAPKFEEIWDGGSVPRAFLRRVAGDERRAELATLLGRIAAFYGVDLRTAPRPRLVLVPVPAGWGTHAQAVGRNLLLEIRPGDDLAQQAAVIVHENAHFLFGAMQAERRARLASEARAFHGAGEKAWNLLEEALPTAFGQGIADQCFRPAGWSRQGAWYHNHDVDAYAKALHAAANHALETGGSFDERFLRHALLVWEESARGRAPAVRGMQTPAPRTGREPTRR